MEYHNLMAHLKHNKTNYSIIILHITKLFSLHSNIIKHLSSFTTHYKSSHRKLSIIQKYTTKYCNYFNTVIEKCR